MLFVIIAFNTTSAKLLEVHFTDKSNIFFRTMSSSIQWCPVCRPRVTCDSTKTDKKQRIHNKALMYSVKDSFSKSSILTHEEELKIFSRGNKKRGSNHL